MIDQMRPFQNRVAAMRSKAAPIEILTMFVQTNTIGCEMKLYFNPTV